MGTSITIRVVPDAGENIVGWQLTGADLYSFYLLDYYWSIGPGPVLTPDQTYTLPALRPWIDETILEGDIVMAVGPAPGPNGPVRQSASFGQHLYRDGDTQIPDEPSLADGAELAAIGRRASPQPPGLTRRSHKRSGITGSTMEGTWPMLRP